MDGGDGSDEVIQNPVRDRLSERACVPERMQIKFQGFAFDTFLFRGVANGDSGEVRLAGDGAERGEFGSGESDLVGAAGFRVGKSFQTGQRGIGRDGNFTTEEAELGHGSSLG